MNKEIYTCSHEKSIEEKKQEMEVNLASLIHKEWRRTRLKPDGTCEPRIKKTIDTNWIEKNKGDGNVDIANTKFEDLPEDWQQENLSSSKVAVEKIEDVLNLVHDKWLDRNDENAGPDQKVQFSRLSPAEKLKDIAILKKALEVMEKSL